MKIPSSRPYKQNFRHHSGRRKHGHDYKAPCRYHVTISKASSCPDFSVLRIPEEDIANSYLDLTPIGEIIDEEVRDFQKHHPKILVRDHIVMPDHLHIFIEVIIRLEKAVGNAIGGLKSGIVRRVREITRRPDLKVFDEGFNDKVVFFLRDPNVVSEYIRQNPYRLAVRIRRPDFFEKSRMVRIDGRQVQTYGNRFHFRNPFKYALIIHRSDNEAIYNRKLEDCLYYAENGGVVVSAFISAREKAIRKRVEEAGGRIILVRDRPFEVREKPAMHDFSLCCDGKLLIISPLDYHDQPKTEHPSRSKCLDMNALAELICR